MNENENLNDNSKNKNEIDLVEVAIKLWGERILVLKILGVFFVLALIVAFGSKKEYSANCSFILDDNQGGSRVSGLVAQFGGLAGINLNNPETQGIISPEMYPNLVKSTPFLLELLDSDITVEKFDTTVTVFKYFNDLERPSALGYIKKYTIGLPGVILERLKKDTEENSDKPGKKSELLRLSKSQYKIMKGLSDRISIQLDEKTGIIELSIQLPDPVGAAELTKITYDKLTEYLIEYKIDKATLDFNFINDRYAEAENRYEFAQKELAQFRDQNKNIVTAFAQTEEERLQNDYQLAFNVYNGLAQQLEQARIEVQEAMPVFKQVESVTIPINKSKPRTVMTVFLFSFAGLIFSLTYLFIKMFY